MAKERMYRSGIYGHRYKGYYISPKGSDTMVYDPQGELFSVFCDEDDAIWAVDMLTATKEDMETISRLDSMEIYELDHEALVNSRDREWAIKIRDIKLRRIKG